MFSVFRKLVLQSHNKIQHKIALGILFVDNKYDAFIMLKAPMIHQSINTSTV